MCQNVRHDRQRWASGSARRPAPGRRCRTPRWTLFARQGFDGTTVEEIADACEVSPRTFFRYFPTKEDVLFADAEARRERLLAVLADQPADEPAVRRAPCGDAGARRSTTATTATRWSPGRRSSQGVAAAPGLQGRAPARLGGRRRRRARAAPARRRAGRAATSCSCSPRSPPRRCASRSTRGSPTPPAPTSTFALDDAFAPLWPSTAVRRG